MYIKLQVPAEILPTLTAELIREQSILQADLGYSTDKTMNRHSQISYVATSLINIEPILKPYLLVVVHCVRGTLENGYEPHLFVADKKIAVLFAGTCLENVFYK